MISIVLGHSTKMSHYSGILYAKFFDCGVSLLQHGQKSILVVSVTVAINGALRTGGSLLVVLLKNS
jgi:hypothetical protein